MTWSDGSIRPKRGQVANVDQSKNRCSVPIGDDIYDLQLLTYEDDCIDIRPVSIIEEIAELCSE